MKIKYLAKKNSNEALKTPGYLEDTAYLGRTIGRIANRIKNGEFEFRGKTTKLHTNLPPHHLHGGPNGIAKVKFKKKIKKYFFLSARLGSSESFQRIGDFRNQNGYIDW